MGLSALFAGQLKDTGLVRGRERDMDISSLVRFLHQRTGMKLGTEKRGLVECRLGPIAAREKLGGVGELIELLKSDIAHPLWGDVVDAMTTHETFFFRDQEPFEYLRNRLLPALLTARSKRRALRIWSAACSTGQEPYSVAMLLAEIFAAHPSLGPLRTWKIEIVATDIGARTLQHARNGIYSRFEVGRGLPKSNLTRWFQPLENGYWQAREELRSKVLFKAHNLMDPPTSLGVFDLILCRNLLIYFDMKEKREILSRLGSVLSVDGRLMLGSAETLFGVTPTYARESGTTLPVYRKA